MKQQKLEPLKCTNCGGPLKETAPGMFKCEYCGSVYRDPAASYPIGFVRVAAPQAVKLGAQVMIDDADRDILPEDYLTKYTMQQLREQLAEGLMTAMRVDVVRDPYRCATVVRGTVRVIPSDFRY